MFYELNTWDPDGNAPWKRTNHGRLFEWDFRYNAQLNDQPLIINTNTNFAAVVKVLDAEAIGIEIPNILPDG